MRKINFATWASTRKREMEKNKDAELGGKERKKERKKKKKTSDRREDGIKT
jgi:hypothetical protein